MGSFDLFHYDMWGESYKNSCFVGTRENSKPKRLSSFILNSILTIFKKKKKENFRVDCYDILAIGIDIIGFDVNIISDSGFTIILYLFLLHILLEGEY